MSALFGHNHSRRTTLKYRDEHAIFRQTGGRGHVLATRRELVGTIVDVGPILINEVLWPRDLFVTYEQSDEQWAIPLGFATVVPRSVRFGDVIDMKEFVYDLQSTQEFKAMVTSHTCCCHGPICEFVCEFVVIGDLHWTREVA